MKIKELYNIIKPLVDIIINNYFKEKYDFIINIIETINTKASEHATGAAGDGSGLSVFKCTWIYKIYYYLILLIFLFCFLWIIRDIYIKNYYSTNAYFSTLFKSQLKLNDIPEFNQIKNIIYITDFFSVDINFIFFIIIAIIIIAIAYYFHFILNLKELYIEFNLFIPFIVITIILGVIYYIYNFNHLNILSRRINSLIELIYSNINMQFINDQKICNYLQKKDKFDDYFVYGNCNDMKYLFNQSKLYSYITFQINEVYSNDNNVSIETFKSMKDSKGILYKDKLKNAFFTFSLMRYYIDNNLLDNAKDFFSTYNLMKLRFKPRINPILNLNYDSILFNATDLSYNIPEMQKAFNNNKDIYNFVYNDFYNINSTIQKLIVDIYNICKYKMICVYYYYLLVGIIMTCIIIYYFIKKYYNR
jgi:hypothetical protein